MWIHWHKYYFTLAEEMNRMSTDSLQAESFSFYEDPRLCHVSALLRCCNTNFQGTVLGYLVTHCWTCRTWDSSWVFLFVYFQFCSSVLPHWVQGFFGRWEGVQIELEVIALVLLNTSFCNPSTEFLQNMLKNLVHLSHV